MAVIPFTTNKLDNEGEEATAVNENAEELTTKSEPINLRASRLSSTSPSRLSPNTSAGRLSLASATETDGRQLNREPLPVIDSSPLPSREEGVLVGKERRRSSQGLWKRFKSKLSKIPVPFVARDDHHSTNEAHGPPEEGERNPADRLLESAAEPREVHRSEPASTNDEPRNLGTQEHNAPSSGSERDNNHPSVMDRGSLRKFFSRLKSSNNEGLEIAGDKTGAELMKSTVDQDQCLTSFSSVGKCHLIHSSSLQDEDEEMSSQVTKESGKIDEPPAAIHRSVERSERSSSIFSGKSSPKKFYTKLSDGQNSPKEEKNGKERQEH
jgi:hypothetical protein